MGDESPSEQLLNYNENLGDTSAVGSYPAGARWVGALDMAGNVWEWVGDWYGTYPSESQVNPTGPTTGDFRVARGGSWGIGELGVPAAHRAARAGLGHSVLIAGEAGVGKSRLLAEMSPDVAKLSAIGAKFGIDILGSLPLAAFHS